MRHGKNCISKAAKTGKMLDFVKRSGIQARSKLSLKKYSLFF